MKLNLGDTITFVRRGEEIVGTVTEIDNSDPKQPYRMMDRFGDQHWPFIESIRFEGDLSRIEDKLDKIMRHLGIADD